MDNENVVDVVKIEIEGEDRSATGTLDKVLAKLERIKTAGSSGGTKDIGSHVVTSGSISKLDQFRQKLSDLQGNINSWFKSKPLSSSQLSKLNSQADQSMAKIQELKSKIEEMQNSFSDKPTALMQTLIDKENELEAAAKRVKAQITDTTPQALVEKYTQQYDNLRSQIEQISNRQLELKDNGRAFLTVAQQQPEAFEQLNEQLNQEEKRFAEINDQIKSGTSNAKAFGKEVRNAFSDSVVGRFTGKIKQFASSIKRIVLYRAIRSLINQVTSGFKSGIDNMYQYSLLFQGSLSNAMDRAASSMLSFKNSVASAAVPLIEFFIPYLDKAVDKLMEINNTIAMVFAGLTGKSTYSKAVRATASYADSAAKASKNTDKLKDSVTKLSRSFAGLDEITVIGDNYSDNISSLADTVAENIPDYSTMFVETPVDMAKIDEFKEKLEDILILVGLIGAAIAAWKFTKALTGASGLSSALTLAGVALTITGATLIFKGIKDVVTDGMDWTSFWELFFGSGATTAGAAVLGGKISQMFGGSFGEGAGTGARVGAGVGGAAMFFSGMYDTIVHTLDSGEGDLESMFTSYFSTVIGGALIGTAISPGIGTAVGALVGGIADAIAIVASNPETMKKGTEAIKKSWENGTLYKDMKEWVQKGLIEAFHVSPETAKKISGVFGGLIAFPFDVWERFFSPVVAWTTTNVILPLGKLFTGLWNVISKGAQDIWVIVSAVWITVSQWFNKNVVQPTGLVFSGLWNGIVKSAGIAWTLCCSFWAAAGRWFSTNVIEPINKLFPGLLTGIKKAAAGAVNWIIGIIESGINVTISGVNWFIQKFNSIGQWASDVTGLTFYYVPKVQEVSLQRVQFADGGFPEDGFFYANHNELVGQFSNGRTAVANNEQIVEGISNGVSQANEETNSLLRENNRLMRQLLSKDSTIDVSTIASAFNRKNQRDGKVTVPVSV